MVRQFTRIDYEALWDRSKGFRCWRTGAADSRGDAIPNLQPLERGRYLGTNWECSGDLQYLICTGPKADGRTSDVDTASPEENVLFTALNLGIGPADPKSFKWAGNNFQARSIFNETIKGKVITGSNGHPMRVEYTRHPHGLVYSTFYYTVDYQYNSPILENSLPDAFVLNTVSRFTGRVLKGATPYTYQLTLWTNATPEALRGLNPHTAHPTAKTVNRSTLQNRQGGLDREGRRP